MRQPTHFHLESIIEALGVWIYRMDCISWKNGLYFLEEGIVFHGTKSNQLYMSWGRLGVRIELMTEIKFRQIKYLNQIKGHNTLFFFQYLLPI